MKSVACVTRDFTTAIRRALIAHQFSDILGIFKPIRVHGTRPAGDRVAKLRARILRDGWLPNATSLEREWGFVPKTFHRDLQFLRRNPPRLNIRFDNEKLIYVLEGAGKAAGEPAATTQPSSTPAPSIKSKRRKA